jgi:FkbM family methyltransferase
LTHQLSKIGIQPKVLCVEPEPANFEILNHNVNGLAHGVNAAIWSHKTTLSLDTPNQWNSFHSYKTHESKNGNVAGITIPDLISENGFDGSPLIVKCDIEGAEIPLILSGDSGWMDQTALFFVEEHERYTGEGSFEEVHNILLSQGFEMHESYKPGTHDRLYVNRNVLQS